MNPNNPPPMPPPARPGSLIDAIRGPIMLLALGILMAADQMGRFGIQQSWPALLILFGLLKLAAYGASTGGHQ